jgi:hypothetical protein
MFPAAGKPFFLVRRPLAARILRTTTGPRLDGAKVAIGPP